jgi:predicted TIM-barrel enzyme
MPYGDANAIVLDMGREVLTIVKKTPVLAGVCGTGQSLSQFVSRETINVDVHNSE